VGGFATYVSSVAMVAVGMCCRSGGWATKLKCRGLAYTSVEVERLVSAAKVSACDGCADKQYARSTQSTLSRLGTCERLKHEQHSEIIPAGIIIASTLSWSGSATVRYSFSNPLPRKGGVFGSVRFGVNNSSPSVNSLHQIT
jgi:hypothetical protein